MQDIGVVCLRFPRTKAWTPHQVRGDNIPMSSRAHLSSQALNVIPGLARDLSSLSELKLRPKRHHLQELRGAQAVQVQNPQATVFHTDELMRFQDFQGFVHPLPGQAYQIGQLLLRDAQHFTHA